MYSNVTLVLVAYVKTNRFQKTTGRINRQYAQYFPSFYLSLFSRIFFSIFSYSRGDQWNSSNILNYVPGEHKPCCRDLDLGLMILKLDRDIDIFKKYFRTENEVAESNQSKIIA